MVTFEEFKKNNVFVILRNATDLIQYKEWLKYHNYCFLDGVDESYETHDFVADCYGGYCGRDTLLGVLKNGGLLVYVEDLEPTKPKYEWVELDYAVFHGKLDEYAGLSRSLNDGDLEIFFNYYRYHEEFDDVDFGKNKDQEVFFVEYNSLENYWRVNSVYDYWIPCGLYFSTKEHAENFIKLLEENVNERY